MKIALMVLLVLSIYAPSISHAECNKKEAASIVRSIVDGEAASREDGGITIWYTWRGNWSGMSKDQKYKLIQGLSGVEHCLKPGVTTRIRAYGRDVAKGSARGVELLD